MRLLKIFKHEVEYITLLIRTNSTFRSNPAPRIVLAVLYFFWPVDGAPVPAALSAEVIEESDRHSNREIISFWDIGSSMVWLGICSSTALHATYSSLLSTTTRGPSFLARSHFTRLLTYRTCINLHLASFQSRCLVAWLLQNILQLKPVCQLAIFYESKVTKYTQDLMT